ncbi:MAG: hypothetical protein KME17_09335 [Cyanosarcina radialis HA8281-LM2]|jgi:hypothetical protein|nr:hypothetical protein [Cyanosarcina radialis HA8281-LM2]
MSISIKIQSISHTYTQKRKTYTIRKMLVLASFPLVASPIVPLAISPAMAQSTSANKFGGNQSWTQNPYFGSKGTFFADVTGNRRADAIVVNHDRVTVRTAIP